MGLSGASNEASGQKTMPELPKLFLHGPLVIFNSAAPITARHQGRVNILFCDGHVESPLPAFVFEDSSEAALVRWNRGHQPHRGALTSEDGINFIRQPKPVLFPAVDDQQKFEWTGGWEDPRLAEREDGAFVVTFTQYTGPDKGGQVRLGLASSTNLTNWTKHGSPFTGTNYGCADTFVGVAMAECQSYRAAAPAKNSN